MIKSEFGINRMRTWIPIFIHTTVQAGGGGGVMGGVMVSGDVFLAHLRPLSANWALFKCHGLPEHCF